MTGFIEVQTTTESEDEAACIADRLLELRVAACVQISGPVTSRYRWQGELESSREWVCTAKTAERLFSAVETEIREVHSYDEPQIIAIPIVAGSDGYLSWLKDQLLPPAE